MKKILLLFLFTLSIGNYFSQVESLSVKEKAFKDSIAQINEAANASAEGKEAYNRGINLYSEKKLIDAIKEFEKAILSDPKFLAAYYNKGVAENELEAYLASASTLNKLISIDSTYSKAYFQRARAFQGLKAFDASEKNYEKALTFEPNNVKIIYNYGVLRFMQQDYKDAISKFSLPTRLSTACASNSFAASIRV
jgi:tetratricopeptide (TPR) repeat protein